jgi:hypothetical protein
MAGLPFSKPTDAGAGLAVVGCSGGLATLAVAEEEF